MKVHSFIYLRKFLAWRVESFAHKRTTCLNVSTCTGWTHLNDTCMLQQCFLGR